MPFKRLLRVGYENKLYLKVNFLFLFNYKISKPVTSESTKTHRQMKTS